VFVERKGKVELTDVAFDDDAHLLKVIDRIVSRMGRRIDEASPMADARLPDGSRVNAIIPPLALDGPSVTIRRFATVPLGINDLIAKEAMSPAMAELLSALVKAKANIVVAGGTGSGKTTLLNILSGFIPENERIITLEDTAELQLQQVHVVRLESRPPNVEDKGAISMRALVRNSLRMRPDRIVVGEVRGGEVIDMLQAMNTGHSGSLTTVHANTARDTLGRLENLVSLSGMQLPMKALRQQIVSAVDIIVQTARISDGTRKVISISEITGMEGDVITLQDIFVFTIDHTDNSGKVVGRFTPTGVRPRFADQIQKYGISLDPAMFDPNLAGGGL
jgi:pilus assembly protein CpaF